MNTPARLHKEVNMSLQDRIEQFIIAHATFFLSLCIIILLALFLTICVHLCGVCAVDSGGMRNFIANGA